MSKKVGTRTAADMALMIIEKHGGVIRTKEAIQAGIHPRVLYSLRDSGGVERISRGESQGIPGDAGSIAT